MVPENRWFLECSSYNAEFHRRITGTFRHIALDPAHTGAAVHGFPVSRWQGVEARAQLARQKHKGGHGSVNFAVDVAVQGSSGTVLFGVWIAVVLIVLSGLRLHGSVCRYCIVRRPAGNRPLDDCGKHVMQLSLVVT